MRVHGKKHLYQYSSLKLEEVMFEFDKIEELDKIIEFLQYIREDCKDVAVDTKKEEVDENDTSYTYFHYRDWDETWRRNKDADIFIALKIINSLIK